MNNITDEQADRAYDAVREHTGLEQPPDELETEITDLLANLMHLCNREKVDFNLCLQNAQMHYNEEKDNK